MPSGVEVAQAYITIIPSMKGIQGEIAKQLNADVVGNDAGKKLGAGISKGVSKSSEALMKSFDSVSDRIAYKTKTGIGVAFENVAKGARSRMEGVASAIGTKFASVGNYIAGTALGTAVGNAFSKISGAASAAFSKVSGTVRGVAGFIGESFSGIAAAIGEKLAPIKSVASNVFGKVGDFAKGAFDVAVKSAAIGGAAIAASVAAIVKASIDGFSQYEQLAGGAQQIFSGMDYSRIEADAQSAYKTMGMSANQYLESINQVGAAFKATMGDEAGYQTAQKGMQAISDYASGTGRNIDELNQKYALITRSTSSYQSIADQFSGILPATSAGFLEQAQAAGLLSDEYTSLTEVPIDQYQQAVTDMLARGVDSLNLTGNTAREAEHTISGSIGMMQASWANFVTELGKDNADIETRTSELVDSVIAVAENVGPRVAQVVGALFQQIPGLISQNAPKVAQAVTQMLDGVTNGGFSKMVNAVKPYVDRIGKAASDMAARFKPLAPVVSDIGSKLGGILMSALSAATGAFEHIAPIIATIAEHALPILSSAIGIVGSAFDAALSLLSPVASFLSDVLGQAVDWIGQRIEDLASLVEDAFGAIADAAGFVGDFLSDPLGKIGDFAKSAGDFFTKTSDTATKSSATAQRNVTKSFNGMNAAVSTATANAASTANSNMTTLSNSVSTQGGNAATSAEKNGERIKTAWNKTYETKMNASAHTDKAERHMSDFKNRWSGFNVNGYASVSTWGAEQSLRNLINGWSGFTVRGNAVVDTSSGGGGGHYTYATGAIIQKHADGFIANRPGRGVNITQHIAGESGAEAIIPLTNKRYVQPFAQAVADNINLPNSGGVVVTGNTFVVRKESDIPAIGRAINQEAERRRRAKL